MEFFGYVAAVLIGVSLGLIGGGGSIFTVPVLVYLFGIDVFLATEYSLFVVRISSLIGSLSYFKNGLVDLRIALIFGIPSIFSIFFTRSFLLPLIPDSIFEIGDFILTKNVFLLLIFAGLMIIASYKMIRKNKISEIKNINSERKNTFLAAGQGSAVGVLTGLVGAGGGFIIIPALVNFLKIPMKIAVGTSLVIISFNSLIGFFSSVDSLKTDWSFLGILSLIAIVGILIGTQLSKKINGEKLKPAFGWFILVMGVYIILKEMVL